MARRNSCQQIIAWVVAVTAVHQYLGEWIQIPQPYSIICILTEEFLYRQFVIEWCKRLNCRYVDYGGSNWLYATIIVRSSWGGAPLES